MTIKVRRPTERVHTVLASAIASLWTDANESVWTPAEVDQAVAEGRVIHAYDDEEFAGAVSFKFPSAWTLRDTKAWGDFYTHNHSHGYIEELAVRDWFRGRGIGKRLASDAIDALDNAGATGVYVCSWLSGAERMSLWTFLGLGFEPIAIRKVWPDHPMPWGVLMHKSLVR